MHAHARQHPHLSDIFHQVWRTTCMNTVRHGVCVRRKGDTSTPAWHPGDCWKMTISLFHTSPCIWLCLLQDKGQRPPGDPPDRARERERGQVQEWWLLDLADYGGKAWNVCVLGLTRWTDGTMATADNLSWENSKHWSLRCCLVLIRVPFQRF